MTWISTKDRLPETSMKVLARMPNPYMEGAATVMVVDYSKKWEAFNAFDWQEPEHAFNDVSHWMPIPEFDGEE